VLTIQIGKLGRTALPSRPVGPDGSGEPSYLPLPNLAVITH